jgi:hypothetical protein
MTYLAKMRPVQRPAKRGLGDLLDVLNTITNPGPSEIAQCIGQANATTAPLDAKINDLAQNWQPTGFYTPEDIRQLVGSTMAMIVKAQAVIDQARQAPNASQDSLMRTTDDLARAGKSSLDYLSAANDADAQSLRAINAVGFKDWVLSAMGAASSAIGTAAAVACITPWWVGALATFQTAFDALWNTAKQVVGAVLAIGETALKVADELPQFSGLITWGLVLGGAYWLWHRYLKPSL